MKKIFVRRKYNGWMQLRASLYYSRHDVVCNANVDPNTVTPEDGDLGGFCAGDAGFILKNTVRSSFIAEYAAHLPKNENRRFTIWRRTMHVRDQNGNWVFNPLYKSPLENVVDPKKNKKAKERKAFVPKSIFHSTPLPLP